MKKAIVEVEAIGTVATLVKVSVQIAVDGAVPTEAARQTTDEVAVAADTKVTCLCRVSIKSIEIS